MKPLPVECRHETRDTSYPPRHPRPPSSPQSKSNKRLGLLPEHQSSQIRSYNWCDRKSCHRASTSMPPTLRTFVLVAGAATLVSVVACQQQTWEQQIEAAVFAHQDGELEAAEEWFRAAEQSASRFDPTDPRLALTLGNLADFYHSQARDDEAEPLYRESLELLERAEGPDSTRFARFAADLALFYTALDRVEEAEPLYRRALEALERMHGPDDDEALVIRTALARFYLQEQRYGEAEPLYRKALALLLDTQQSNPDQLLTVLDNYASLLRATGRNGEAIGLETRANALRAAF